MIVEPIKIEFKYPWIMLPLEKSGEWIEMVKTSLQPLDPLFGKDIFLSGRHEFKNLLLVDNDTDDSYAIISIKIDSSTRSYNCATVEVISSREELAKKLQHDHEEALNHQSKHG